MDEIDPEVIRQYLDAISDWLRDHPDGWDDDEGSDDPPPPHEPGEP